MRGRPHVPLGAVFGEDDLCFPRHDCSDADPHPGNVMIRPDGTIGLIELGSADHLNDLAGQPGPGCIEIASWERFSCPQRSLLPSVC